MTPCDRYCYSSLSLFLSLNLVVGVGKESFVSWIAEAILHFERQESFFFFRYNTVVSIWHHKGKVWLSFFPFFLVISLSLSLSLYMCVGVRIFSSIFPFRVLDGRRTEWRRGKKVGIPTILEVFFFFFFKPCRVALRVRLRYAVECPSGGNNKRCWELFFSFVGWRRGSEVFAFLALEKEVGHPLISCSTSLHFFCFFSSDCLYIYIYIYT